MFKQILLTAFITLFCLIAPIASAQITYGFVYDKSFDNFNNQDTTSFIELAVFNSAQDTLQFLVGSDVTAEDGTAINGTHYKFQTERVTFKPGLVGYSSVKKVKLNLIPNNKIYGTLYFNINLINIIGILPSQLNYGRKSLKVILGYDGSSIGIPTVSFNDYKLYPNPTKNDLFIEGVSCKNYTVYNATGQEVLQGEALNNKIDVAELTEGLYVLITLTDKGMIKHNFFKQ